MLIYGQVFVNGDTNIGFEPSFVLFNVALQV